MGQGYCYTCKKCKYEYTVHLGVGMMYPTVYRRLLEAISNGEYGSELQEVYNDTPYAAINGNRVIYLCNGCGYWEHGTDISLYEPNDPESIPKKQYGIKTVEEWGHVPYVTEYELKENYHQNKRYYHRCCNCGKRMHKTSSRELKNLPCPNCGCENQSSGDLFWD